jgi:hypothetical protein
LQPVQTLVLVSSLQICLEGDGSNRQVSGRREAVLVLMKADVE